MQNKNIKKNFVCVMPMAGEGLRFKKYGYKTLKPLITINKVPMFIKAIKSCIEDETFIKKSKNTKNPYGEGNSGKKIADVLSRVTLDKKILRKKMTLQGLVNDEGWFS